MLAGKGFQRLFTGSVNNMLLPGISAVLDF